MPSPPKLNAKVLHEAVMNFQEKLFNIREKLTDGEYKGLVEELAKLYKVLPPAPHFGDALDIVATVLVYPADNEVRYIIHTRKELANFFKNAKAFIGKDEGTIYITNHTEADLDTINVPPNANWGNVEKNVLKFINNPDGSTRPQFYF